MIPARLRLSFLGSLVSEAMIPHEKSWFEPKSDTTTIRDLAVSLFVASSGQNRHARVLTTTKFQYL